MQPDGRVEVRRPASSVPRCRVYPDGIGQRQRIDVFRNWFLSLETYCIPLYERSPPYTLRQQRSANRPVLAKAYVFRIGRRKCNFALFDFLEKRLFSCLTEKASIRETKKRDSEKPSRLATPASPNLQRRRDLLPCRPMSNFSTYLMEWRKTVLDHFGR